MCSDNMSDQLQKWSDKVFFCFVDSMNYCQYNKYILFSCFDDTITTINTAARNLKDVCSLGTVIQCLQLQHRTNRPITQAADPSLCQEYHQNNLMTQGFVDDSLFCVADSDVLMWCSHATIVQ